MTDFPQPPRPDGVLPLPQAVSLNELADYLLDVGGTLLAYGCPTYRLETVIREIAALEGCVAEVFGVPTGLWMSLRHRSTYDLTPPVVRMTRVKEWVLDLDRLTQVDHIFNDVLERKYGLAEARRRLDTIEAQPSLYPLWLRWLASGCAAGSASVAFRGGWREVLIAAVGGVLLGILRTGLGKRQPTQLLSDFLGGLFAGLIALVATLIGQGISRETLVLSIVVLQVPGLSLTAGLAEIAHRNLVSGAARLMETLMVFLFLVFGIAVSIGIERLVHPNSYQTVHSSAGVLFQAFSVLIASVSFTVIFSTPLRFIPWGVISGVLGWSSVMLGSIRSIPASLSSFFAALVVSVFANTCARISRRPAQLYLLPGMVLLVPGSFGFMSLESFLHGQFQGGASRAFDMFLIAGAIVTGLLMGNVVLPAKKLL